MKFLLGALSVVLLLSHTAHSQINRAGSRAAIKVTEVEGLKISDLSPAVSGQITYRLIYSEDVLRQFTDDLPEDFQIDFREEMLIVLYNGTGNGKVNCLGATYLLKPQYLKVGYSVLEKLPFSPYTIIRIKKLDFKKMEVLPYKKYVKSKEKWF